MSEQVFYIRTSDPAKIIRVPVDDTAPITLVDIAPMTFTHSNPFTSAVNKQVREFAISNGLRVYKIGKVALSTR